MVATLERPARQRWSTADVDPKRALAYWVDTVCESFLEIDIDSPEREHFHAQLEESPFGPADLYLIEAGPQTVRRTPARISRTRYAAYFLLQLREGQLRFRQHGRECDVHTGDCVLVDCQAPYLLDCLPTTRTLALRLPQEWLKNWLPAPEDFAARPFRSGAGWGAALSAALANLDVRGTEELALPAGVVAEQITALLALAAGSGSQPASASEKLLARLKRSLRDACHDPELTPAALADLHGISKRYLHYVFANAGTTFGHELMRLRLECAHRLLSDRRYATLPVSEIALRCGFLEPSHFARRFRRAFGLGPTAFRAAQFPGERLS